MLPEAKETNETSEAKKQTTESFEH
jgi:hypothetical protein